MRIKSFINAELNIFTLIQFIFKMRIEDLLVLEYFDPLIEDRLHCIFISRRFYSVVVVSKEFRHRTKLSRRGGRKHTPF